LQACSAWLLLTPTPKTIEIPTTPLNDISTVTKPTRTNLQFLHTSAQPCPKEEVQANPGEPIRERRGSSRWMSRCGTVKSGEAVVPSLSFLPHVRQFSLDG
jgi:hypothetical protein